MSCSRGNLPELLSPKQADPLQWSNMLGDAPHNHVNTIWKAWCSVTMTLHASMLLLNFLERVGRLPSTCNCGCLYRATHTDRPGGDSSKLCCVPASNSVFASDAPGTYRRAQGTLHFTLLVKCKLLAMTLRLVAILWRPYCSWRRIARAAR